MSDKLNRLADDVDAVAELVHEDAFPHSSAALRRVSDTLRTLAPVLAKCEGAMEDALRSLVLFHERGLGDTSDEQAALRTALAALREVGHA